MKKIMFLLFVLVTPFCVAQKSKTKTQPKTTVPKNVVLATLETLSAEIITDKKGKRTVLFVKNATAKDTIELKNNGTSDFKPSEFILKKMNIQGKSCYLVQWKESKTTETKLLKEITNSVTSQIWEIDTKTMHLENSQKTTQITETIFLDKNKTASHTVEKSKSEGFEFVLNPDGTFTLKSKTQNNTYQYNAYSKKFDLKNTTKNTPSKK